MFRQPQTPTSPTSPTLSCGFDTSEHIRLIAFACNNHSDESLTLSQAIQYFRTQECLPDNNNSPKWFYSVLRFDEKAQNGKVFKSLVAINRDFQVVAHTRQHSGLGSLPKKKYSKWGSYDRLPACFVVPWAGRVLLALGADLSSTLVESIDPVLIITSDVNECTDDYLLRTSSALISVHDAGQVVNTLGLKVRCRPLPAMVSVGEQPSDGQKRCRVACLQAPSRLGDVEHNTAVFTRMCRKVAKEHQPNFIVMPETAITGYLSQDLKTNWRVGRKPMSSMFSFSKNPEKYAETIPGPSTQHFGKLSKELNCYITVPLLEKACNGDHELEYYNSIALCDPQGNVAAHYRKNTPWPTPEQSWASAGTDLATADTPFGRVGLAICFDIHKTVPRYVSEKKNIFLLLYPIAWVDGLPLSVWYHSQIPESVMMHGRRLPFHIAGCNWSSEDPVDAYAFGCSTIYRNDGKILSAAETVYGEEIIVADLPCQSLS